MRATRILVLAVAALAITVGPAGAASSAGGFSITPLRADVDVKPGASMLQPLTISNTTDRAATYTLNVQDIQGDKDDPAATPVILPGKLDSDVSGYDWLSAPTTVRVAAGETRTVQVKVAAPAGATGGHYAAVMVEGPPVAVGNLTASSRIALPFLMNAGGAPPPDIVITEVREVKDGGTKVVYRNTGKVHTRPKGTITRRDPITHKIIQTDTTTSCTTALPGGTGECTFHHSTREDARDRSSLGPNDGFVDLVTTDGKKAHVALPTEWSGTWSSMLLPVIGLALFASYFLFLRRRRRAGVVSDGFGYDD